MLNSISKLRNMALIGAWDSAPFAACQIIHHSVYCMCVFLVPSFEGNQYLFLKVCGHVANYVPLGSLFYSKQLPNIHHIKIFIPFRDICILSKIIIASNDWKCIPVNHILELMWRQVMNHMWVHTRTSHFDTVQSRTLQPC